MLLDHIYNEAIICISSYGEAMYVRTYICSYAQRDKKHAIIPMHNIVIRTYVHADF